MLGGDGLKVAVRLKFRIDVLVPIKLIDDEVKVAMPLRGHVLHKEFPRNHAPLNKRLIHGEYIAAPLRLVGAQRSRCVQDAWLHEPAGANFQPVCLGNIKDAVVARVPMFKAAAHIFLGGSRYEPHESVREIVANGVVLRRKVVRLGLAFASNQRGLSIILMHVVRNRPHVVKELRVHGPLGIFLPQALADQFRARLTHRLPQRESLVANHAVRKAFIRRAIIVCSFGGGTEPAFVDAAAVQSIGVRIRRMQLDAQTRLQK